MTILYRLRTKHFKFRLLVKIYLIIYFEINFIIYIKIDIIQYLIYITDLSVMHHNKLNSATTYIFIYI
jgi:hypothetical protein